MKTLRHKIGVAMYILPVLGAMLAFWLWVPWQLVKLILLSFVLVGGAVIWFLIAEYLMGQKP